MAQFTEHGIRLSSMCPTFLNSNSTSHTWPFSAIAELIDNAADPGVFAKHIWININEEAGQLCMTFTDNGSGMTPNKLHKMLSFGFTEKGVGRTSLQAIGVYGNGFKSGSMRLGRDALIFTKNGGCQSVGMLSQTYLENIKAQSVIVPIVPFNQQTNSMVVTDDSEASLAAILQHSIISSQEQIQAHFDSISTKKGTKILIWNLRRAKDGNPEIDFETDPTDFRLPEIQIEDLKKNLKSTGLRADQIIPDMHYSLKAYLSILYLRPRIQIILRGKKIPTKLVSQQLTQVEYDVYKPHFSKDKVKVTFGINEKNKECYGIMMYHKNRLIKAYEKVGCQLKPFGQRAGVGVIGIIECDFLKPAHNKQDFEYTKEYRLTLGALGMKLNDYWRELTERKTRPRDYVAVTKDLSTHKQKSHNDPMWLQCEECLKWRSVPAGHYRVTPENWSCSQNPNPRYRSCSSPEESDDNEDLLTASYQKNHHKRESSRTRSQREKSPKFEKSASQKSNPLERLSEMVLPGAESTRPAQLPVCADQPPTNEPEETDVNADQGTEAATTCTKDRDSVIKDTAVIQTYTAPEPSVQQDEEVKEIPMEQEETTQEHGRTKETISIKRKLEKLFEYGEKRRCLLEEHLSSEEQDNNPATPGQSTNISVGQEEIHDVVQPNVTQEDSREARVKKLEELERESHKLRLLLGLETVQKSQPTVKTAATNTESPKRDHRTVATREIEVQTEVTEPVSSGRKTPVPKLQDTMLHGPRAMCGFKDPEQNKSRKERNDSSRSSENDDHNANRMVHDKLCGIRNNVVVLLTALLPQLDLSGISMETSDVDNILQQIIEVNALKL